MYQIPQSLEIDAVFWKAMSNCFRTYGNMYGNILRMHLVRRTSKEFVIFKMNALQAHRARQTETLCIFLWLFLLYTLSTPKLFSISRCFLFIQFLFLWQHDMWPGWPYQWPWQQDTQTDGRIDRHTHFLVVVINVCSVTSELHAEWPSGIAHWPSHIDLLIDSLSCKSPNQSPDIEHL